MTDDLFTHRGLSLDRLASFAAIAKAGGITAASGGSPSRQSQLSRQLKELEGVFGAELVRRGRGQFALTQAGRELLTIAQHSFGALQNFALTCAGEPVSLRIAAGESLLQGLIVPVLPELERVVPNANWTLLNRRSADTIEGLVTGDCDLGIVRQSGLPKSLKALPVGEVTHVLVIPPNLSRPLPKARQALWDGLPLALAETAEMTTASLAEALGSHGLTIRLHCSSLPQAAEAVRQGMAAAILPQFLANKPEFSGCQIETLPSLSAFNRRIAVAWNPKAVVTRPVIGKAATALAKISKARLTSRVVN
jgi:DNA-binding transcriptional LysR family regulator